MKNYKSKSPNISGCFFILPNELFTIGLSPGEIAVYSYLVRCENRVSHQCWPSYKSIGDAVGMSPNTVSKYVQSLIEKELIYAEPTKVTLKNGYKRNGNMLYTVLPFQDALKADYEQQFQRLDEAKERHRISALIDPANSKGDDLNGQ